MYFFSVKHKGALSIPNTYVHELEVLCGLKESFASQIILMFWLDY